MVEELIDVRALAAWLGVSPAWVYRESELGRIPRIKISGKLLRFSPAAIRGWLADRSFDATGPTPTARSRRAS